MADVAGGGPVLQKRSKKAHYSHEAPWLPRGCASPAGVLFSLLFQFFGGTCPSGSSICVYILHLMKKAEKGCGLDVLLIIITIIQNRKEK